MHIEIQVNVYANAAGYIHDKRARCDLHPCSECIRGWRLSAGSHVHALLHLASRTSRSTRSRASRVTSPRDTAAGSQWSQERTTRDTAAVSQWSQERTPRDIAVESQWYHSDHKDDNQDEIREQLKMQGKFVKTIIIVQWSWQYNNRFHFLQLS